MKEKLPDFFSRFAYCLFFHFSSSSPSSSSPSFCFYLFIFLSQFLFSPSPSSPFFFLFFFFCWKLESLKAWRKIKVILGTRRTLQRFCFLVYVGGCAYCMKNLRIFHLRGNLQRVAHFSMPCLYCTRKNKNISGKLHLNAVLSPSTQSNIG